MAAIHVRDVPDQVVSALKRRAARNQRSLQGELRSILAEAARDAPDRESLPSVLEELDFAEGVPPSGDTWSREEIYGDDER
jgi:plasmid stability protein